MHLQTQINLGGNGKVNLAEAKFCLTQFEVYFDKDLNHSGSLDIRWGI